MGRCFLLLCVVLNSFFSLYAPKLPFGPDLVVVGTSARLHEPVWVGLEVGEGPMKVNPRQELPALSQPRFFYTGYVEPKPLDVALSAKPASVVSSPAHSVVSAESSSVSTVSSGSGVRRKGGAKRRLGAALDFARTSGGVVISLAPLDLTESLIRIDVLPALHEKFLEFDLSKFTFEQFSRLWFNIRHSLCLLRERLFAFRRHCTRMLNRGLKEAFVHGCNECFFMDSNNLESVPLTYENVVAVYSGAREKFETALFFAQRLLMGDYVNLNGSIHCFPGDVELPLEDVVAIGLLNRPLCMECTFRKKKRVVHPNYIEQALTFDDTCTRCKSSLLRLLYDDHFVFDPASGALQKDLNLIATSLCHLEKAYQLSDGLLKTIYLGDGVTEGRGL